MITFYIHDMFAFFHSYVILFVDNNCIARSQRHLATCTHRASFQRVNLSHLKVHFYISYFMFCNCANVIVGILFV